MDALGGHLPTYADFRSPCQPSTRYAKQFQKYYGFRSGPMSRIGQPILSAPDSVLSCPWDFMSPPLIIHPEAVRVRIWTKQDQFRERTTDIWPLDRKDHKFGRRKRGRGCNYVPERWKMERSMKGRRILMGEDERWLEEIGADDAEMLLTEARCEDECKDGLEVGGFETRQIEPLEELSDDDYDLLSDIGSELDESDWDFVNFQLNQ